MAPPFPSPSSFFFSLLKQNGMLHTPGDSSDHQTEGLTSCRPQNIIPASGSGVQEHCAARMAPADQAQHGLLFSIPPGKGLKQGAKRDVGWPVLEQPFSRCLSVSTWPQTAVQNHAL